MKVLRTISLLAGLILVLGSCYYDVEEELYPSLECQTMDMSYSVDILPIIDTDCYACHSAVANFGNVTLEGHAELIKYVNDNSLLGVIKHSPGFSPMPKNVAKLLDCEVEKIEAWIAAGALDN